jgi:serine/threonine protein kinase
MPLAAGTRCGPYEILAPIGAGGMGEVYRARDTKLKRDVALKVLPEAFAKDPGRMLRFQREAEVLASLNHPNIAHIYGVEERALVMELVEGESPKGPLPFDDAWKIMLQIADALEYAHEKGVIHRDLKPANVKVTPDGVVKLLDFGLAKAFSDTPDAGSTDPENSPTITLGATVAGTILGTAAYMSPEQAKGKKVDKRADIWSWGVVLYELLTGERLFKGGDTTDTLAQVLTKEPPLERVLPQVRKLLEECLQKDPKQRLRDIGDAKRLLAGETVPAPSWSRLAWAAAAVFALAAAALGWVAWHDSPQPQRSLRLSVPLPENMSVMDLALAPDASRLALVLSREDNPQAFQIYLRSLDSDALQPLAGTEGAHSPFWSHNSRFIGFYKEGKLKIIPATGGPASALCDASGGGGGAWHRDGVILFWDRKRGLQRVNERGGQCSAVGKEDPETAMPVFLPEGKHFLYVRTSRTDSGASGVYLASLDQPTGRKILSDLSNVAYAPPVGEGERAHILFLREDALMAQPFDDRALQPVGDPFVVAPYASPGLESYLAASVAPDGTLAYLVGRSRVSRLTWFDRGGKEMTNIGPRVEQGGVSLSPNGQMVAVAIVRQDQNRSPGEVIYDLARGPQIDLTPPGSFAASGAVWSPEGDRVVFAMTGPEGSGIYEVGLKGGPPRILDKPDAVQKAPSDWSHDGKYLIYSESGAIWYVPCESGKPGSRGTRVADGYGGQLSPDGKWLAYSAGLGRLQIRPFPTGESVWQVPADNASQPRWHSNGKELYFISGAILGRAALMAAPIEPDGHGGVQTRAPHRLFDVRVNQWAPQMNAFSYSPSPDGQRFLVNQRVEVGEPAVTIITKWQKAAR